MNDQKSLREKRIFSHFAKISYLPIRLDSVEKRQPPEPDIICVIEGEGRVTFEMLEIIDNDLARQTYGQVELIRLFKNAYENLPSDNHSRFKQKFDNALIHVRFYSRASSQSRRNAISIVLNWLMDIDKEFIGNLHPPLQLSELSEVLKSINITRGKFNGPCFDVEAAGSFSNPIVKRINTKFSKKYITHYPIELLAYYDLQPVFPESTWLPKIQEYVQNNLKNSLFRKVWIFDIRTETVKSLA